MVDVESYLEHVAAAGVCCQWSKHEGQVMISVNLADYNNTGVP